MDRMRREQASERRRENEDARQWVMMANEED